MNYYKRHLGDYAAATQHLSMLEHGAYNRLLDVYYVHEKPLPVEERAVHRLVGARSKEEREAVTQVLGEFFELQADGWHSKRADAEITASREVAETNRRIAVEREAKKKAKPVHDSGTERARSVHEPSTPTIVDREPIHKPLANNHKKDEEVASTPPPVTSEAGAQNATPPTRKGELSRKLRSLGVDAAPHLDAWPGLLSKFSDEEILAAAERARESKPGERLHLNYLVPMLNDRAPTKAGMQSVAQKRSAWGDKLTETLNNLAGEEPVYPVPTPETFDAHTGHPV